MNGSRFVEYDDAIHLINAGQPEYTLCGDAYDISAVDANRGEFRPTKKTVVTCRHCADIIESCRGVRLAPPDQRKEWKG